MKRFIYSVCLCVCCTAQTRDSYDGWWIVGAAGAALTSCAIGGLLGKHLSDKHIDHKRRADIADLEQQMYRARDVYKCIACAAAHADIYRCADCIYASGDSVKRFIARVHDDSTCLRAAQVRCASYQSTHHDPVVREVARAYQGLERAVHALLHDLERIEQFLSVHCADIILLCKKRACSYIMSSLEQKYLRELYVYAQERNVYRVREQLCSSIEGGSLCAYRRYPLLEYVVDLSSDCKKLAGYSSYIYSGDSIYQAYTDMLSGLQNILSLVSQSVQYRQQKQQQFADQLQEQHLAIEQERLNTERERLCVEQEKVEQAYRTERSLNRVRCKLNRLLDRLEDDDLCSEIHEIVVEL